MPVCRTTFAAIPIVLAVAQSCGGDTAEARTVTPAAVATVIHTLQSSNDSTERLLDNARLQLDTALQSMVDVSSLLDRLAGQPIEVERRTGDVEGIARDRESASAIRNRSMKQLEAIRRRLVSLSGSLETVNDTSHRLRAEVDRLTHLVTSLSRGRAAQEERLDRLTTTLQRVSAERNLALARNIVYEHRVDTLRSTLDTTRKHAAAREDSVFVLIADGATLRTIGVAEWKGGMLGVGKVLRLRSDFPKTAFTVRSKRSTLDLPMPRADRTYRVVSPQRESCFSWANEDTGTILRVSDPDCFWEPSKYLVIEEHK